MQELLREASALGDKQRQFTLILAKLILYAYSRGYELTLGEGYVDDGKGHMPGSVHYVRIAQDLNLFKNKVWLDKGPECEAGFAMLHDYWDSIGGSKRIDKDMNHFSLEYQGRRIAND
jgi:hypothetical protein